MKIKKGDNVMVIAGRDRGKTGLVQTVLVGRGRAVVGGVALVKKHIKPSRRVPSGGIIDINLPVDVSNLAIVCPSCGKPSRVGYKIAEDKKIRICKKCEQSIEHSTTKNG
ncbi:MAG: 50S ribosomal protein L24 [Patescibacteria group bacterium]